MKQKFIKNVFFENKLIIIAQNTYTKNDVFRFQFLKNVAMLSSIVNERKLITYVLIIFPAKDKKNEINKNWICKIVFKRMFDLKYANFRIENYVISYVISNANTTSIEMNELNKRIENLKTSLVKQFKKFDKHKSTRREINF